MFEFVSIGPVFRIVIVSCERAVHCVGRHGRTVVAIWMRSHAGGGERCHILSIHAFARGMVGLIALRIVVGEDAARTRRVVLRQLLPITGHSDVAQIGQYASSSVRHSGQSAR